MTFGRGALLWLLGIPLPRSGASASIRACKTRLERSNSINAARTQF
jgi:hypothetical protein